MLKKRLVDWINGVWYGPSKPPLWLRTLVPFYKALQGRRIAMAHRVSEQPNIPVIVVGNLVVGGSGKTPVVARIVAACHEAGYQAAVISRGYGAKAPRLDKNAVVLATPTSDPALVGDEPVLLARITGANVWVGRDRQQALAHAVAAGAQVIISDDGLQHPALQSSYRLCLIDGKRGFGNGYLLPAGPLRESPERLNSMDQILIKEGGLHPDQPHTQFELVPLDLMRISDGAVIELDALKGKVIEGVCAIAHPESFQRTLEKLGAQVNLWAWPDHHLFSSADLIQAYHQRPMVITQKDWVKIEPLDLPAKLTEHIYVLRVEARLDAGLLDALIAHVRKLKDHD